MKTMRLAICAFALAASLSAPAAPIARCVADAEAARPVCAWVETVDGVDMTAVRFDREFCTCCHEIIRTSVGYVKVDGDTVWFYELPTVLGGMLKVGTTKMLVYVDEGKMTYHFSVIGEESSEEYRLYRVGSGAKPVAVKVTERAVELHVNAVGGTYAIEVSSDLKTWTPCNGVCPFAGAFFRLRKVAE